MVREYIMHNYFPYALSIKKMKYVLYLTVFFLLCTWSTAVASMEKQSSMDFNINYKEVLILSSQSDNSLWEGKLLDYLNSKFSTDSTIRLYTEILSSIDKDSDYMDKEAEFLFMKYAKTKFNLIICMDDESAEFIEKYYHKQIIYDTPIIYCGINDVSKLHRYPYNLFSGVMESINPRMLIDTILGIHPQAAKINIILDETIASDKIENLIRNFEPYYSAKVKFNFIKSNYIEDISLSLNALGKSYPSILVGNFKNSSNVTIDSADSIKLIKSSYTGPLYTLNPSYMEKGVIGGYLLSPVNHGKLTYEIATRVLNGDSPHSVAPILDSDTTFIFDLEEVIKTDIDRKTLPKNTVFINENWINRKFSAVVVLSLLSVLLATIILMMIFAVKKNENEKKAKLVKARYDEVVVNDKIKTEFITNFSHEIRTLLNLILSSVQLLDIYREAGRIKFEDEKDALKLTHIRQNGLRLLKIINNLIDITKLDSGFYNTVFETTNIVDVIEDISLSVVEYAEAKDITVIFDTNEEEFFMPVDIEKLDRIMLNLLSNAIKFTPNGGAVYVTLHCQGDKISISVKDTGVGIAKEEQELIFNRFIQASNTPTTNSNGSGIGLSLIKSIIDLLDGTIELNSSLNEGAEFIITLPVKDFDNAYADTLSHVNKKLSNNKEKLKIEFSDINL